MRRPLVVGLILAVLAWAAWRWTEHARAPHAPVAAAADSASAGVKAARLFFASPDGDSLVSETRDLAEAATLHDKVAALVRELDRGPTGGGGAVLPVGTSVRYVYLDENGLLTLDLSGPFAQGFRGGTSAEYLAVASLVRTVAANLPEVKRVLFACGGAPLATLGGHVPLDRPLDVSDWP